MPKKPRTRIASQSAQSPARAWLCVLLLIGAGALAYGNSLSGPFIVDDGMAIVGNAHIRQLWPLSRALSTERESPVAGRPFVSLSFAINYAIGGLDVGGYHVVNVALHVVCAVLLFGVIRRTLARLPGGYAERSTPLALVTALLWLVHPLNSEAVDYLTQRTELMMGVCYLLTFYAAIRARDSSRSTPWVVLAIVACGLGMACKESMVTAPVMVWLYDRAFHDAASRPRWGLWGGLAATWVVLAMLNWSGPRIHSAGWSAGVGVWTYLLNQVGMIVRYLRLAVWPTDLVLTYGYPQTLTLGAVLPAALLVVALLGMSVVSLQAAPRLGFLAAWFFVTLAPTSSVIPIATEVGAERRMYLPLMAFLLLVVLAFDWLAHHLPSVKHRHAPVVRAAAWAVIVAAVATASGLATRSRNREYQTGLAMARTVLSRWPTSYAHFLLGTELVAAGEHQAAIDELRQAVPSLPRAHYALATQLIATSQWDDALDHLQAFVREEPWLLEVPAARNQIGRILVRRGELDAAADQFRLVLQMDPTFSEAHRHLADVFAARAEFPDAIREYQQYIVDHPQDSDALMGLGVAFQKAGRSTEALAALRRALAADPSNALAARNAAAVELARQNYPGSVAFARQAVQANPDDAGAHDLLGLGLAFQGQLGEAIREFQRAIQLSPTDADAQQHLAAVQRARHPAGP